MASPTLYENISKGKDSNTYFACCKSKNLLLQMQQLISTDIILGGTESESYKKITDVISELDNEISEIEHRNKK